MDSTKLQHVNFICSSSDIGSCPMSKFPYFNPISDCYFIGNLYLWFTHFRPLIWGHCPAAFKVSLEREYTINHFFLFIYWRFHSNLLTSSTTAAEKAAASLLCLPLECVFSVWCSAVSSQTYTYLYLSPLGAIGLHEFVDWCLSSVFASLLANIF